MMFRVKGNKIVCLRSEYLSEKKRTHAVQVASFDKWLSTVPEEVCQQLDSDEFDQLKKWLSDREREMAVESHKNSMLYATSALNNLMKALEEEEVVNALFYSKHNANHPQNGTPMFDQDWADKLFDTIADARKALKRAGFKPSPKNPENKAVDDASNEAVDDASNEAVNLPNNVAVYDNQLDLVDSASNEAVDGTDSGNVSNSSVGWLQGGN